MPKRFVKSCKDLAGLDTTRKLQLIIESELRHTRFSTLEFPLSAVKLIKNTLVPEPSSSIHVIQMDSDMAANIAILLIVTVKVPIL